MVTVETEVPDYQLRPVIIDVFGSEGLRVLVPGANPLQFEGQASPAVLIAYKNLGGFEQELIERCSIDLTPTATGTRIQARVQVLNNPGTMFEDAKYPIVGTRMRYHKLLKQAVAEAGGTANGPARPIKNRAGPRDYVVPLPLEGM